MAVRDDWRWSRLTLFYALPAHHFGARGQYSLTDHWALTLGVYNGWNDVVDNNDAKSVALRGTCTADGISASVLSFGGNERSRNAPEGTPWRHLLDAHGTASLSEHFEGQLHLDAGMEPNDFGTSSWMAGTLALRDHVADPFSIALRGDGFKA